MIDTTPHAERLARQSAIATEKNPGRALDYLCRQTSDIGTGPTVHVALYYVPDKLLINAVSFEQYLHSLPENKNAPLEGLAQMILDDLNNQLVPRWIQIRLAANSCGAEDGHRILIEDRAPNWKNTELLSRVSRF